MSIRLKIALILAISCLLGDAFFILLWHPWQTRVIVERERQELHNHIVTLSDALTPFLLQNQVGAIHEVLDATLERQPDWKSLVLYEKSGLLIYPLDPQPPEIGEFSEKLSYEIALRGTVLARIELTADLSPLIHAEQRKSWLFVLVISSGFAVIGIVIGTLLAIVIGRRSRLLVEATRRLEQGEYDAPLPVNSTDEIGLLAHAFDQMRQTIATKEKSLLEATAAAEASNLAKSQFLAMMSHEIRTPMNGILGMAQILLMSDVDDTERQDYARTILNSGQTLLTLLNDILDFSKIEAGKLQLETSVIDIQQLLHELTHLFYENAISKGLQLKCDWQGAASHFLADAHRIRQMLSNLISNAIKFTSSGMVRVEVKALDMADDKALLEFSVSDTGIGIKKEQKEMLFKPFSQVDSSITRLFGGTGLGLSIVHSLALQMGGSVGVDSDYGQGSRFWFRIPVEIAKHGIERRNLDRSSNEQTKSGTILKGNVLVVEDNKTNQKVIHSMLTKLGLASQFASDGSIGVQMLEQDATIDLVLMDVQMPLMDGYAATRHIREKEFLTKKKRLPIIALTADAFEEDRQRCLNAGMDDFLAKPLGIDNLANMLRRWLPVSQECSDENFG